MTAPVRPQKMRIDQYRWAQREGYSDDELREQGYEPPFDNRSPAQKIPPTRSLGERVKGSVAAAAQTAIPIAGPIGVKLAGLDDEAAATRNVVREKVGTGPLLAAELAGGLLTGNAAINLLSKANQANRAVRLAQTALSGSQNKGRGAINAAKRLGINVGSGAAVGAATAPEGSEGLGALIGGGAGLIPSAVEGIGAVVNAGSRAARHGTLPFQSVFQQHPARAALAGGTVAGVASGGDMEATATGAALAAGASKLDAGKMAAIGRVLGRQSRPARAAPDVATLRAATMVNEALRTGKVVTPGQSASGALRRAGAQAPARSVLADVAGDDALAVFSWAMAHPSEAATELRQAMQQRGAGRTDRLRGLVQRGLDRARGGTLRQTERGIEESIKPMKDAAYQTARAAPGADWMDDPGLQNILGRRGVSKYWRAAQEELAEEGKRLPVRDIEVPIPPKTIRGPGGIEVPDADSEALRRMGLEPTTETRSVSAPNLETVDRTLHRMREAWRGALEGGKRVKARAVARNRAALLDRVSEMFPEHARSYFVSEVENRLKDAAKLGLTASKGRLDPVDVQEMLDGLMPPERVARLVEGGTATAEEMAAHTDAIRETFRRQLAYGLSQKSRTAAADVTKQMAPERMADLWRMVDPQGPATLERAALVESAHDVTEQALSRTPRAPRDTPNTLGPFDPWSMSSALRGQPQLAAARALSAVEGGRQVAASGEIKELLSRWAATRPGTPQYAEVLKALRTAGITDRLLSNAKALRLGRSFTTGTRSAVPSILRGAERP